MVEENKEARKSALLWTVLIIGLDVLTKFGF